MSCWSTTACAASGGTGFYAPGHPGLVLTTSDGGANWASTLMPAPQHGVPAIACVSGGACWAGGNSGGIVTNFLPTAKGYWMVGRDGGAFAFGAATTGARCPVSASTSPTWWASCRPVTARVTG